MISIRRAMRSACPGRWILCGLILIEMCAQPRALEANWRTLSSIATREDRPQPPQEAVIFADQQAGNDMGAKIAAANAALGSARGEIRVTRPGDISETITLWQNHDLVCAGDPVTLTLSTSSAQIIQQSDTRVRGCIFSSSETTRPWDGAEIVSQGTSNVESDDVTFIGGGDHIEYTHVSNFRIKNTRHISITATGAAPILIESSTHGQIISPRIEGYTVPAGHSGIRLMGIDRSSFVDVTDPVIKDVDASTVPGCGGVTFTASSHSTLRGGIISGLTNCDGVLTESTGTAASSDIDISGTASIGNNAADGLGKNANNGEGFDIFNSKRVRLSQVTANDDGKSPNNRQPGIEVSNSSEISITNSISSDNGVDGIKIDGSPGVTISESHTNRNGGAGILVMPALGRVSVRKRSPIVDWAPGAANITFSAVWPVHTKIVIDGAVYTIASFQSTTRLTLTSNFSGRSGSYAYNVDSYAEITDSESNNNGQLSAGLPSDRNGGQREGIYFAGGFSGAITGRVTHLRATDTQKRKTQCYGIRVENHARIIANENAVAGNMAGGIRDSPGRSKIR